jgi:Domain of unknown function (DUF6916)
MLETFTVDKFEPRVGDKFEVVSDSSSGQELTLLSAKVVGTDSAKEWSKASGRAPFTLTFIGPVEAALEQSIYHLAHDEMGDFDIFLVPLGPNQQGMRYEAVFT